MPKPPASSDDPARQPNLKPSKFTESELSDDQRAEQTAGILAELDDVNTAASRRKAEIFQLLASRERPPIPFRYLACRILSVTRRCPEGHFRQSEPWQFCRERFFCPECANHTAMKQVTTWTDVVCRALAAGASSLGPAVELEWALANPEDPKSIDRFNYHAEKVWQPRLEGLGVAPDDWLLPVAYDPVRQRVRGLYLGPPTPPGSLGVLFSETPAGLTPAAVSVGSWRTGRWGGQTPTASPSWTPVEVDRLPPWYVGFDWLLREGLLWVVGDDTDRLEADPARAVYLDRLYSGRHLYSTRGGLHRSRRDVSPPLDPATGDSGIVPGAELVLSSGRTEGEDVSEEEAMTISGNALKQLLDTVRNAVRETFSEYQPKVVCPHCQAELQVTFERKLPQSLTREARVQ